jgi:hypothetical protein
VILDHLSLQYATDELLDIGALRGSSFDITMQDSLLAWGLDRTNHAKGKHSKGALICAMSSKGDCGRITLLRNLFAHNRDRNPDVKGTSIGPVEIVNTSSMIRSVSSASSTTSTAISGSTTSATPPCAGAARDGRKFRTRSRSTT